MHGRPLMSVKLGGGCWARRVCIPHARPSLKSLVDCRAVASDPRLGTKPQSKEQLGIGFTSRQHGERWDTITRADICVVQIVIGRRDGDHGIVTSSWMGKMRLIMFRNISNAPVRLTLHAVTCDPFRFSENLINICVAQARILFRDANELVAPHAGT